MKRTLGADDPVWWQTSIGNGMGCAFLGPFLPPLIVFWHLRDRQAGLLLSAFFLGSFAGTLLLSNSLRRTLLIGSWTAASSLVLFSFCTAVSYGFGFGLACIAATGFGLGQLMSAINLIAGSGSPERRAGRLAVVAAAWCGGAALSPILATPSIVAIPTSLRVMLLAPFFLWPWLRIRGLALPCAAQPPSGGPRDMQGSSRAIVLFVVVFFLYGGIEACISGWMPLFAARYQMHALAGSQWVSSVFWLGLIGARLAMNRLASPSRETLLLPVAVVFSATCLLCLLFAPSPHLLLAACALTGFCLGPVFPLILSGAIGSGIGTRAMGAVLASCGLGSAAGPALLGVISTMHGLRPAMLVPFAGLLLLLLLRWRNPRQPRIPGLQPQM